MLDFSINQVEFGGFQVLPESWLSRAFLATPLIG
jgi:hypothetical protein